jgi:hypothetical protein
MVQTVTLTNAPAMSSENFCYWLQGLFELQPDLKELTPEQVAMIKQHLGYVFNRVAPVAPGAQSVEVSRAIPEPFHRLLGTLVPFDPTNPRTVIC